MRTFALAGFLLLIVAITACTQVRAVNANDFQVLRTYGWDSTVSEPQATWSPASYQVLARSVRGFVLLEEGIGRQQYFASTENRDTYHPVWINEAQFAFGPLVNALVTSDGRLVPSSEGLSVVTLRVQAFTNKDVPLKPVNLTKKGYRPRVWNGDLVAQSEDKIIIVNEFGDVKEFGPGFMAEPQRKGRGIAWQERPVFEPDYWSGTDNNKRGRLFIRWKEGTTTELADAVEAHWTSGGGLVATILRHDPLPGQSWYSGGTDIVYLSGPTAVPVLIAADAHGASPHPSKPIVAAVGTSGSLVLCNLDGQLRRMLAPRGDHPQWSHDGLRLMAETPVDGKQNGVYLQVYVFKIADPRLESAPPSVR